MSYPAGFIYCTGLVFIVLVKPLNYSGRLTWPPGDFPFFLLLVGKCPNPLWGWGHNVPIVLHYASHFPCVWGSHPRGPSSLALTCEEWRVERWLSCWRAFSFRGLWTPWKCLQNFVYVPMDIFWGGESATFIWFSKGSLTPALNGNVFSRRAIHLPHHRTSHRSLFNLQASELQR